MRDAVVHPAWHAPSSGFARTLACRLDLRPVELPWPGCTVDAALAVAPAALKAHREPAMPIIVLNRRCAQRTMPSCGASVVCVKRGAPGPTIAAAGRHQRASLVVVSVSTRGRLRQALRPSTTGYLIRRCERPVAVCPRDPAAAMRLREALAGEEIGQAT